MSVTVNLTDNNLALASGVDPLALERDFSHDVVRLEQTNATAPQPIEINPPPPPASASPPATGIATATTGAGSTFNITQVRRQGPHSRDIKWSLDAGVSPITISDGGSVDIKLASRVRVSAWLAPSSPSGSIARKPSKTDPDQSNIVASWRSLSYAGLDDITFVATVRPKLVNGVTTEDFDWADNFVGNAGDPEKFLKESLDFFHQRRVQVFVSIFLDESAGTNGPATKGFNKYMRNKRGTETDVNKLRPLFTTFAKNLVQFFDGKSLDIDGICFDVETQTNAFGAADHPGFEALYLECADQLKKKGRYLAFAAPPTAKPFIMKEQSWDLGRNPNIIVRPMSYLVPREPEVRLGLSSPISLHPGQLQMGVNSLSVGTTKGTIEFECANTLVRYRVGLIFFALGPGSEKSVANFAKMDAALNPSGKVPPPGTLGQPLQGPLNKDRIDAMSLAGATWSAGVTDGSDPSQSGGTPSTITPVPPPPQ